mgnify:CR=1 FL=1
MNTKEKRLFSRVPLSTDVYFEDEKGDRLFYVKSRDISMGGLFLEGELPLVTGTLLFISFALPGHKRFLRMTAEVVRQAGWGVGVRFAGLSESSRRWLEDFLMRSKGREERA